MAGIVMDVFLKNVILVNNLLLRKELDLPEPSTLPGEENERPYPYYFVADEAFPLVENLLLSLCIDQKRLRV